MPSVTHAEPSQPTGGSTSSTVPSTPAATPATPTTTIDLNIRRTDGVVINNEPTAFTACLYKGAYGSGKLLVDYRIPATSKTPLPWENETCDPVEVQIDIMPHPFTCPEQPHGLSPLAAKIFTVPAGKTGEECEDVCVATEYKLIKEVTSEIVWGECKQTTSLPSAALTTCQPNKCGQQGEYSITKTYSNGCDTKTEVADMFSFRPCPCPEPTPPPSTGACYYNVSSNIGPHLQKFTCETKLGGNPLARGEWGRWPSGPPSDHCRFSVPGILSDYARVFQLTPGQSDLRCNRY